MDGAVVGVNSFYSGTAPTAEAFTSSGGGCFAFAIAAATLGVACVLSLAIGSFGIGMTEFVVMGLLPQISADLLPALSAADPDTAQRMGAAGLERVRADFTWDTIARQTVNIYDSLI